MDVIWIGGRRFDDCGASSRELITGLVRRGHRVLHIDPDASAPSPPADLRSPEPGLWVHSHRRRRLLPGLLDSADGIAGW